jgi:hypothetical protein
MTGDEYQVHALLLVEQSTQRLPGEIGDKVVAV